MFNGVGLVKKNVWEWGYMPKLGVDQKVWVGSKTGQQTFDRDNGGHNFNLHTTQALRSKSPIPLGSTWKDVVAFAGAECKPSPVSTTLSVSMTVQVKGLPGTGSPLNVTFTCTRTVPHITGWVAWILKGSEADRQTHKSLWLTKTVTSGSLLQTKQKQVQTLYIMPENRKESGQRRLLTYQTWTHVSGFWRLH